MDHIPGPRELRTAGRACTFMAYTAGLAGIAAGTLLLREGEPAFAVFLWIVTFAVGAALMGVSLLIRAFSGVAAQLSRMESDVRVLADDHARRAAGDGAHDPWRHP